MKNKIKKLITIALATTMLLGMTLTVNAATPRNNWCHPGAADPVYATGTHYCNGSSHSFTLYKCAACGNISKEVCKYNPL